MTLIPELLNKADLSKKEKKEFLTIVFPIIFHPEFIKRCNPTLYPHHAQVSLGEHLLNDAIITYKLIKNNKKYEQAELRLAVLIAMFHDFYELPWQNNKHKKEHFLNKHGFVHPLEAAINAMYYFPRYFKNPHNSQIIIDGIVHHMKPFPVRSMTCKVTELELNNLKKFKKLAPKYQKMLIKASKKHHILGLSFARSNFLEGRIVAKADKKVSFKKELRTFNSLQACLTGHFEPKLKAN